MNRILRKAIGIVLIIVGIIGLVVPFLQGIILILIGISLYDEILHAKIMAWLRKVRKKISKRK